MSKKRTLKELKKKTVEVPATTLYQRYIEGKKVIVEATDLKEAEEKFNLLNKKDE